MVSELAGNGGQDFKVARGQPADLDARTAAYHLEVDEWYRLNPLAAGRLRNHSHLLWSTMRHGNPDTDFTKKLREKSIALGFGEKDQWPDEEAILISKALTRGRPKDPNRGPRMVGAGKKHVERKHYPRSRATSQRITIKSRVDSFITDEIPRSRQELMDAFWAGKSVKKQRDSLKETIRRLNKMNEAKGYVIKNANKKRQPIYFKARIGHIDEDIARMKQRILIVGVAVALASPHPLNVNVGERPPEVVLKPEPEIQPEPEVPRSEADRIPGPTEPAVVEDLTDDMIPAIENPATGGEANTATPITLDEQELEAGTMIALSAPQSLFFGQPNLEDKSENPETTVEETDEEQGVEESEDEVGRVREIRKPRFAGTIHRMGPILRPRKAAEEDVQAEAVSNEPTDEVTQEELPTDVSVIELLGIAAILRGNLLGDIRSKYNIEGQSSDIDTINTIFLQDVPAEERKKAIGEFKDKFHIVERRIADMVQNPGRYQDHPQDIVKIMAGILSNLQPEQLPDLSQAVREKLNIT